MWPSPAIQLWSQVIDADEEDVWLLNLSPANDNEKYRREGEKSMPYHGFIP